jgi:enoyl-CoA hydratase
MTGEMIDATEAFRIGLVNRVVPAPDLMNTAREMMKAMLANAPLALGRCIRLVNEGADIPLREALFIEADAFGELAATADKREGTRAFLEKRPPSFRGR